MHNQQKAFTLIEIMVTTIIIAIIAGISVVSYASMQRDAKLKELNSMVGIIESRLNSYFTKNGEYPSAESLAAGGDGRNLSSTRYDTIASLLGTDVKNLKNNDYKFVPCSVSGTPCTIVDADKSYIMYATRFAADVATNTSRTYTAPITGCTYQIPAPTVAQEGISTYIIMIKDPVDTNSSTVWNIHGAGYPQVIQGAWCNIQRM